MRKYVALVLITGLGYLLYVCVMPYLSVFGVVPNLLYAVIAIVTVAYGKLRALWVGLLYGLLTEIMLPSITYLNLALYSLTTLFVSFGFADKPLKQLEYERAVRKDARERPAWLRTLLCAALNIAAYEAVNVTYISLGGNALTVSHFVRAFLSVLLTTALTGLLMFPLRRLIFGKKKEAPVLRSAPLVFEKN